MEDLLSLPGEVVVQILAQLNSPEDLSCCDRVCSAIHGPSSLLEQALRQRAMDSGRPMPKARPADNVSSTQAHLWDEVLHRFGQRQRIAAGNKQSFYINCDGRLTTYGSEVSVCSLTSQVADVPAHSIDVGGPVLLLTAEGELLCSGWGACGRQLPCGIKQAGLRRVEALHGKRVCAVATGKEHALAVTYQGQLWSWGFGEHGQLGRGDRESQLRPEP